MSAHTPGPWEVSGGDVWPVNGNPRVKIATTTKPIPMNGIDWEANARLIAAAPDLLLALIDAMYQHDHKHLTPDEHWYHIAKRAIAKAEGK